VDNVGGNIRGTDGDKLLEVFSLISSKLLLALFLISSCLSIHNETNFSIVSRLYADKHPQQHVTEPK
jgi:hypothetical protein